MVLGKMIGKLKKLLARVWLADIGTGLCSWLLDKSISVSTGLGSTSSRLGDTSY